MAVELPPAVGWLRRNWNELRRYNFEWVAAGSEGIVAHSSHLDDVIDTVVERGLTNEIAFALVDFDETVK